MISYKDRVEFGSTQWLATARAVLAREISDAHLRPDQEFSLCEAFSGAPAHLGLPGDVASWHIKFANGELTITEGEADGVDRKITDDYHCILPLAMTVYIDPAAKHRAKRENTPLRPSLTTDPEHLKGWADANPLIQPNLDQLETLEPWTSYPGNDFIQVDDILAEAIEQSVFYGADPTATMDDAAERAQELLP